MAKIVAVIQVEGGAGRSTVSTNLAGKLSKLVLRQGSGINNKEMK